MRIVKWSLVTFVLLVVIGFFHYTLPQHDIVRITGTEVIRQDFSGWNRIFYAQPDAGNAEHPNRDLRLIYAAYPSGKVIVYRNEDTGWSWPPYFKFDTSNLQGQAESLKSGSDSPRWVVVTHYGWRVIFWSVYPNAVGIREIAGPDVTIVPWFNIAFFVVLALVCLRLWRSYQRLRARHIEPALDEMADTWDRIEDRAEAAQDRATGLWSRFSAWLDTWRAKR